MWFLAGQQGTNDGGQLLPINGTPLDFVIDLDHLIERLHRGRCQMGHIRRIGINHPFHLGDGEVVL